MPRPKVNTFTIALIKADKIDPDDIIAGNYAAEHAVQIGGVDIGQLFVRQAFQAPPKWSQVFDGILNTEIFGLSSAPGAVLLVEAAGRKFAVMFGLGWALLSQEAIEEQFGLRVTLNSIDPGAIKSLDKRSFDAVATQTREQASREIDVGEFGLDVDQDLLSSVTGTPRNEAWGEKMTGKHSLKVAVYKGIADLPELCASYLERFRDNAYEERFKWIDQIREIMDPGLIDSLDDELIQRVALRQEQPDRCWLAAPDILEWADVAGFKFRTSKSADVYPDIYWSNFYEEIGDEEISLEILKKRYVVWVDTNEINRGKWSVYKCVNFELDRDGKMFLLNGGKWYEVQIDFVQKVNAYIDAIPRSDLELIPYAHNREDEYLKSASEVLGEQCVCMDQNNISYGGGHSKIEFCDLFVGGCKLVHAKRYGASSTLSHLFAQGLTSAVLFVSDAGFRTLVNTKLPDRFKSDDPSKKISPNDYEVVFAIISNQEGEGLTLPFFSRINLQNATQVLLGYGFKVSLLKIGVEE